MLRVFCCLVLCETVMRLVSIGFKILGIFSAFGGVEWHCIATLYCILRYAHGYLYCDHVALSVFHHGTISPTPPPHIPHRDPQTLKSISLSEWGNQLTRRVRKEDFRRTRTAFLAFGWGLQGGSVLSNDVGDLQAGCLRSVLL